MPRRGALLPALGLGAIVVSFMQALVVPAVAGIAHHLGTSANAASWTITANLLACAVLTPLLGRLGDMRGRRTVLLGAMGACLAGSLLAAATSSFALLIVARVLQGASGGVFPLTIGVLREELDGAAITRASAIVSGMLSFGAGLGLVLTGVLTQGGADYHRIFWLASAVSAVAIAGFAWAIPRRPVRHAGRLDVAGAALLGAGLLLVLLTLTEAPRWGLTSARTAAAMAGGLALLGVWLTWERRVRDPLVDPVMMLHRPVLITNLAGLVVGLANFVCFLGITSLAQIPHHLAGYGFDASVLATAVVFLLPGTLASAVVSPFAGELVHRCGGRRTLGLGGVLGAVGFLGLAVVHGSAAVVVLCGVLVLCSVSVAYAAMPALLMEEVAAADTAVANSVNSIARWVGGAVGSALVMTLLANERIRGTDLPAESAFVTIFALAAAGCMASIVLVVRGLPRSTAQLTAAPLRDAA